MDVLKEIYWKSALGILPSSVRSLVLLIFSAIVTILFTMLYLLLKHGHYMNVQFGY